MHKMKVRNLVLSIFVFVSVIASAQFPDRLKDSFPTDVVTYQNISYANDTLKNHLLDIYLPAGAKENLPVIVWVHGGGWEEGDKYTAMVEMKRTVKSFIEKGYALASINYRYIAQGIFPVQIQDCVQALQFIHDNARKYKLDNSRIALIGFSAGGHLGSLLALSNNNDVPQFYPAGKKPSFKIKAALDFYGVSHFLMFFGYGLPENTDNSACKLLGASPLVRPDISALASPVTFVDKHDPPFLIVHGEKDQDVPLAQSYLLKSSLNLVNVKAEMIIVKDAPHHSIAFDEDDIRLKVLSFLDMHLK